MWILIGNWQQKGPEREKREDGVLESSPVVSGLAAAPLPDLGAWRRADQIRDTVRQMSALAFCSRLRAAGANTKEDREKTARAKAAREDIWHRKEQCRGGRCAPGSLLIQRHAAAAAGRLLCHGSVRQQPVWAQSDTTSLDKLAGADLTLTDLRGGTGSHACTK